jgi:hypothetical protein
MDYFRFSTHLDGPAAGGLISLLLIASIISQPMVISARSQVNVMPYASGTSPFFSHFFSLFFFFFIIIFHPTLAHITSGWNMSEPGTSFDFSCPI